MLIKSEDVKELLFQGSSDLMLYMTTFGRILKINKAGLAFSGFSEEEVIGEMFLKIPGVFSKRDVPKYLKVFKNTLTGKETKGFLGTLNDKTGKVHLMDFSTYPIKENRKIKYVLVIGKDVTEQKETEKKYRLIAEHTSDLVTLVTFTLNPTFTYVSPSHEKVLGYKSRDLIGKSIFDLIHPVDKKNTTFLLKKYVSAKAKKLLTGKNRDVTESLEFRFKGKSGNWHYLETTANLMGSEILAVSRDVTERKKSEEEIRELNENLEKKVKERTAEVEKLLKQKDDFINQLGHDLKTPLTPVIALLPILEKRLKDSKSKEILKIIKSSTDYMRDLVVKTIQLARLNAPGTQFDIVDTNLLEEANKIIDSNQLVFKENKIAIENKIKEDVIVKADKLRLDELFNNLITNAVKYTSEDSILTIDAKEDRDFVTVSFKDTGIGLTKEQIDNIFDEFYKVDPSRHDSRSSGLGLPICKRIVEKHGGKIWAESSGIGKGSTFHFTLKKSISEKND